MQTKIQNDRLVYNDLPVPPPTPPALHSQFLSQISVLPLHSRGPVSFETDHVAPASHSLSWRPNALLINQVCSFPFFNPSDPTAASPAPIPLESRRLAPASHSYRDRYASSGRDSTSLPGYRSFREHFPAHHAVCRETWPSFLSWQ